MLLVDAEPGGQAALAAALAEAGFEVLLVSGALAALEALADGGMAPQMVIASVELPDGDGFSLCGQVRADPRTAHLPVVLLAKREEDFHRDLAGGVGADDYLAQPADARDVVALARLKAGRCTGDASFDANTEQLPLTDVSRALLAGVRSGRVVMSEGQGWFAFRHGLVVDAVFNGERGSLAFRRMLCFGGGDYALVLGPELHKGSFSMDRPYLCETVLQGLERFDALRARGLPLASRLTVDFARLAEVLASLPEDVGEVVRLFDGRRTLRAMLLECPFPEAVSYEASTRLFALGVLVPACLVEERERARCGATVPGFFEPEPSVEAVPVDAEGARAPAPRVDGAVEPFTLVGSTQPPVILDFPKKSPGVPSVAGGADVAVRSDDAGV
ncbi:Phosphate regulon transcriptional regulatory protein PhoB (SphR) [Myxococcus hansupus]|uniref:Phosphate regulon transcriptional regulatory protein PhoB (SphR) n=1 Tax=Pseudomyxococcus hansupus TaxID=1297742 RepID=A0A0H4WNI9_9BACT|nr:response regulator [Myxococcus hansupus]AKQ65001.1 Phosphate regulon transcriptional regulatory protein PhoB (SphR) [Myxococcus hansupus]